MRGKCWLWAATMLLLASLTGLAMAQGPCGDDDLNPCGPIPWRIPAFPILYSPTPYTPAPTPTPMEATYTPSPTNVPTITPTASPTFSDHGDEFDTFGTLAANQAAVQETLAAMQDQQYNDMSAATAAALVGEYAGTFAGYVKGLQLFNLRGTGGVIGFVLLAIGFALLVFVVTSIIPIVATFARWVMRVAQLVAEFLPF